MPDPVVENIPASLPADQVAFFTSLKSSIEFVLGHGRHLDTERALRVKELESLGIDITRFLASSSSKPYEIVPSSSGSKATPHPPKSFVVTKGPFVHSLAWVNPLDPIVSHIEVWVAEESQDRGDAWLEAVVTVTDDLRDKTGGYKHSGFDVTHDFTYWIRSISYAGKHSEWHPNDIQGGYVVTGSASVQETIEQVLSILNDQITESQLYADLNARINKIETNETAISNEQTIRENADTALAQNISTVQSSVDGFDTAIQTNATSIDGIQGKYSVKIDNNGYLTGFGLISTANDGPPTSEFILLVDKFKIVAPGKAAVVPFAVGNVDGVSTVGINGNQIIDGTLLSNAIKAGAITAEHLAANQVLIGHTVQSSNYVEGQSGWQLNKNGELRLADSNSSLKIGDTVDGDYCEITDGDINFYQWLAGTHRVTKSLKRKEEGSGASGSWIYLPGYWGTIPSVDVFAASLPVYNPAYSNQQQKLRCELTDIDEYAPNQYRIRGNNVLELSGSSYQFNAGLQQTVTKQYEDTVNIDATSSQVTSMPANTRKVTVDTQLYVQTYSWSCIIACSWWYITMYAQWRLDYYDGAWKSTAFSPNILSPWDNYMSYTFTTPTTATDITRIRLYAEVTDFGAMIGSSGSYPYSPKQHYRNYYFKINNVSCTLSGASIISTGEIAYRAISE